MKAKLMLLMIALVQAIANVENVDENTRVMQHFGCGDTHDFRDYLTEILGISDLANDDEDDPDYNELLYYATWHPLTLSEVADKLIPLIPEDFEIPEPTEELIKTYVG